MRRSVEEGGFTLIELMIIVMIIGVLAAIAVPSYRQYVRKNAQSETQSNMLKLSIELEQWRAKALTYGGFTPSGGWSATAVTVYLPKGSSVTTHNYAVQIKHVGSGENPVVSSLSTASPANSWAMVATPRSGSLVKDMPSVALTSQGVRCLSKDNKIMTKVMSKQNCGTGSKPW